jgi:hypothetical protein
MAITDFYHRYNQYPSPSLVTSKGIALDRGMIIEEYYRAKYDPTYSSGGNAGAAVPKSHRIVPPPPDPGAEVGTIDKQFPPWGQDPAADEGKC